MSAPAGGAAASAATGAAAPPTDREVIALLRVGTHSPPGTHFSKRNILKGVLFDSLSSPLRRIAVGDDQDMIDVSVARSDTLPAILKPLKGCRGMN